MSAFDQFVAEAQRFAGLSEQRIRAMFYSEAEVYATLALVNATLAVAHKDEAP
jgi:hypothetical protein